MVWLSRQPFRAGADEARRTGGGEAQGLGLLANDAVILGLMLGFAAIIGDLGESIIKRSCDVKDSGHLLPGIGGALDLIDSILFTAPKCRSPACHPRTISCCR